MNKILPVRPAIVNGCLLPRPIEERGHIGDFEAVS
jgi:hypothetical protein